MDARHVWLFLAGIPRARARQWQWVFVKRPERKENFTAINAREILDKVAALRQKELMLQVTLTKD
jgi:hypothetical protein